MRTPEKTELPTGGHYHAQLLRECLQYITHNGVGNPELAQRVRWAIQIEKDRHESEKAALSARSAEPVKPPADLHQQIMNLKYAAEFSQCTQSRDWRDGYTVGHRDARHAAAELVSAALNAAHVLASPDYASAGQPLCFMQEDEGQLKIVQVTPIPDDAFPVYASPPPLASLPGEGGEAARCPNCDDTGDVHRADGEWLGKCTCPAASPSSASPGAALRMLTDDEVAACTVRNYNPVFSDRIQRKFCEVNGLTLGSPAPAGQTLSMEALNLLERINRHPENLLHDTMLRSDLRRFIASLPPNGASSSPSERKNNG